MGLSERRGKVLIGALFILIGVGLLAAAAASRKTKRDFIRNAATADGVVVRLNAGGAHPQIEFTSASGQRIAYPQGGFIFGYQPGDHVRVLYNSDNPLDTACVDSVGALWFAPIFLFTLGVFFVIIGLLLVRMTAVPHLS